MDVRRQRYDHVSTKLLKAVPHHSLFGIQAIRQMILLPIQKLSADVRKSTG